MKSRADLYVYFKKEQELIIRVYEDDLIILSSRKYTIQK